MTCWGDNSRGQCNPPTDVPGWLSVAAGDVFTCGITTANELRCWGTLEFGALDIPYPAANWTAVSTGTSFACGVLANGTATCWVRQ